MNAIYKNKIDRCGLVVSINKGKSKFNIVFTENNKNILKFNSNFFSDNKDFKTEKELNVAKFNEVEDLVYHVKKDFSLTASQNKLIDNCLSYLRGYNSL